METRKLYYEDCHRKTFSACVTECLETEKGYAVILDATAFYPEGGGQACDLGSLGDVQVLDVQEKDGKIIHLCTGALPVGEVVEGYIDYARRFDLMQQHTGEHIVSGIIHKLFGLHNVGFHVGGETVTIDFDGMISGDTLAQIELEANRAVWANLPVRCWYPGREELPNVVYRAKRQLPWPVRIVQIEGVDSCACCGVHTAYTGEVGVIKIFSCVKFHNGVRLEMACGARALDRLNRVYEQNRLVSQAFSAKPLETGVAAQRMNTLLAEEKYRAAGLEQQVLESIAKAHVGEKNVLRFVPGLSAASVRQLAQLLNAACPGITAVFSGSDSCYDVCLAGPADAVKALGADMAATLGGRGGGRDGFYQGKVYAGSAQIQAFFSGRFS